MKLFLTTSICAVKHINSFIVDYKITSTAKGSVISEFINKNNDKYKIFIVEDINNKSEKNI